MTNEKFINEELIKIFNSMNDMRLCISTIQSLKDSKVLSNYEIKFCNEVINQIEVLGSFSIEKVIYNTNAITGKNYLLNKDLLDIHYDKEILIQKIDNYIKSIEEERLNKLAEDVINDVKNRNFSKKGVDFLYNSFIEQIDFQNDNEFNELEDYKMIFSEMSTGTKVTDELTHGLIPGFVTTIVGDSYDYKSLWALNIAYSALSKGYNVLYLSVGLFKRELYERFIIRHSCDDKFSYAIDRTTIILNRDDKDFLNYYHNIYSDFKNNLLDKLIVIDENEADIYSHYSLLRLMIGGENEFKKRNNKGIDLLIVDDFTYMKFNTNGKWVTGLNSTTEEYYPFFKNQARNFIGSGKKISIVVTYQVTDFFPGTVSGFIPNNLKGLSDNIFLIYCDSQLSRSDVIRYQIYKNYLGNTMNGTCSLSCSINNWHLYYEEKLNKTICDVYEKEFAKKTDQSVESVLENNAKTIEENKKIDLSGLDDMLGDLFEDTNKEKDIKGFEISFKEEK